MPSKKQKLLTPSQMKCKKPRVVNYKDDLEKQQKARDIIILYVDCGLGYSPIRHVVGCKNDKLVEDVVRQHMLGRNNVDAEMESSCVLSLDILVSIRKVLSQLRLRDILHR